MHFSQYHELKHSEIFIIIYIKATNTYEALLKYNAHISHVGVVAVFMCLVLLPYTFTLCLQFLKTFLCSNIFFAGISQIRNIYKKQAISFQFFLGFLESLMVVQSSTETKLLGSPSSQKLENIHTQEHKKCHGRL